MAPGRGRRFMQEELVDIFGFGPFAAVEVGVEGRFDGGFSDQHGLDRGLGGDFGHDGLEGIAQDGEHLGASAGQAAGGGALEGGAAVFDQSRLDDGLFPGWEDSRVPDRLAGGLQVAFFDDGIEFGDVVGGGAIDPGEEVASIVFDVAIGIPARIGQDPVVRRAEVPGVGEEAWGLLVDFGVAVDFGISQVDSEAIEVSPVGDGDGVGRAGEGAAGEAVVFAPVQAGVLLHPAQEEVMGFFIAGSVQRQF